MYEQAEVSDIATNRTSFTLSNQAAGCAYNRSLRRHSNMADDRVIMAISLAMARGRSKLEPPGGAALQYQESNGNAFSYRLPVPSGFSEGGRHDRFSRRDSARHRAGSRIRPLSPVPRFAGYSQIQWRTGQVDGGKNDPGTGDGGTGCLRANDRGGSRRAARQCGTGLRVCGQISVGSQGRRARRDLQPAS